MADQKSSEIVVETPKVPVKVAEAQTEPATVAKKPRAVGVPKKKTTTKKAGPAIVFVKSKRKRSIARASAQAGTGKIRLNGFDINVYEPLQLRRLMLESLTISKTTHDVAKHIDIKISVHGGGNSSSAQAVRGAIAKCIVGSAGTNEAVKREIIQYDRFMLIDDARRIEPKKFKGPKARARFQKSYR